MADKTPILLLFRATGELARRMLLPSLYGLDFDGLLSAEPKIAATARTDLDDAGYRPGLVELRGIEPLTSAVRLQRLNAVAERKS